MKIQKLFKSPKEVYHKLASHINKHKLTLTKSRLRKWKARWEKWKKSYDIHIQIQYG